MKTPSRRVRNSVIVSLLLHAILFLLVSSKVAPEASKPPEGAPPQVPESITAEILPPPETKDADTIQKVEKEGDALPAPPTHLADDCKDFFGGVGLMNDIRANVARNRYDAVVTDVYPGYPAFKAGVQVGDILIDSDHIRGEIGSRFTLEVIRNGQTLYFDIIRDKICTNGPPKGAQP